MSDDAPTPEPAENAPAHPSGSEPADKVSFEKGAASGQDTASAGQGAAGEVPRPDPWAPPVPGGESDGPGHTIASGAVPAPPPPSVHDQRTAVSLPGATPPPAPDNGRSASPWAAPVAPPNASGPAPGAYPPPNLVGGPAAGQGSPFAPPAPGEPVPPPPIAPEGPGQMPYGYPGGYGYPAQPGRGGAPAPGAPGYYGWPGLGPQSNNNAMGTAGLVLGILSAIVFCLWPIAIVLGVLGVIFGAVGRTKATRGEASNPGQALAGIICGAVGIVLGIGMIVLLIVMP